MAKGSGSDADQTSRAQPRRRGEADSSAAALAKAFKAEREWEPATKLPAIKGGTYVGFEMAYFDLETTELNGRYGRIICGGIANQFGETKLFRRRDLKYHTGDPRDDSQLALAIRDELEKYDIMVGWNSSGFDLPFLNARLMVAGYKPVRSDVMHADIMWRYSGQSRWSARFGRRKLQCIQEVYETPNAKTPLDWEVWERAKAGDGAAENMIEEHNIADVLVTRDVFGHTKPLIQNIHR